MKKTTDIQQQKSAWLGDAVVLLYVRAYLLKRFPDSMKEAHSYVNKIVSDRSIGKYYMKTHKAGYKKSATRFEADVHEAFALNPEKAQSMVEDLCNSVIEKIVNQPF